jgi:hypothetical protein
VLVDVDVDVELEFEWEAEVDAECEPGRCGNDGQLVVRWYAYPPPCAVELEDDAELGACEVDVGEVWIGVIPNARRTECARCCGCGVPLPRPSLLPRTASNPRSEPPRSDPGLSSASGGGEGARDCSVNVRSGPRNGDVLGVACGCQLPFAPAPEFEAACEEDACRMCIVRGGSLSLIVFSLRGLALSRSRRLLSSAAYPCPCPPSGYGSYA